MMTQILLTDLIGWFIIGFVALPIKEPSAKYGLGLFGVIMAVAFVLLGKIWNLF